MFKKIIVVICVICVIGFIYLLISKQGDSKVALNVDVLGTEMKLDEVQLIDVREPEEYLSGHADGAINVPLDDILAGKNFGIDKAQSIYVYCRTGIRAEKAKVKLEKDGYKKVKSIGGISDWEKGGGKVCKSDKPKC